MISVEHVSKHFGQAGNVAVRDATFEVPRGQFVALCGELGTNFAI